MTNKKKCILIIGGDFNAELGPGKGAECESVGKYTRNESNKRGDWLKSWLMLNDNSALNTMFRKTPQKQTSFVSPKGKEKQIDHILTKRRYLRNVKDAEANDMIHMGSDHRCVVATFLINTPEKKTHVGREDKKHETNVNVEHKSELEERYQDMIDTVKKAAAKKENEVHDTRNDAKDQVEKENAAAAAEAEITLVDAEAQETEGRSTKRSSKAENQRGGSAQQEHGRQDGWMSTPRGSDDEKKCNERDRTTGERLQNQRPHPLVRIGGEEDQQMVAAAAATCGQGSDCRNNAHLVMTILNAIQKNISVHKFHIRSKRQVLSCSITAAARACSRTTTKKHG